MKLASISWLAQSLRTALTVAACLVGMSLINIRADDSAAKGSGEDLLAGPNFKKHWTTTGNWIHDDAGVATLKPRAGESGWTRYDAYLWLNGDDFQDFEADFEYKVEKGSNSGFYLHVGDVKSPVATGVEVQIYDSFGKGPDAKLTDHDSGGIIPGTPPTKNSAKAPGEWNHFVITSKGDKLTITLNDVVVNEVDLASDKLKGRPKTGSIGFQDHGLPLALRKFTIRKL